jgi:hypothetical protein
VITALDRVTRTLDRTGSWAAWRIDAAQHAAMVVELRELRMRQGLHVIEEPDGSVWVQGRRIGVWREAE